MGNKHSKWFPEASRRKWTCRSEERYTQLLAHQSRPRSRKTTRKCVLLETIDEEWLISHGHATAQNSQELLLPQDIETHPVAQMPLQAVQPSDVTQPTALMDQKTKEARVKMKRIQEAKSDRREQPYPVTSPLAEDPMLPNASAPGIRKGLTEEAKKVSVWNVDDLTPEDETVIELEEDLFEYKERAAKEILAPVEHGTDGLHCKEETL